MKKSILTLGALAVVGGLGLAGSAQAVWYFGAGNTGTTAANMSLNPGSVGNELIIPYYTAAGSSTTLFSIVNTDIVNGKAVKVRFRGANNSDDVLDFTVLMSPGDVWTAQVTNNNGTAHLKTTDHTCTMPNGPISVDFDATTRLPTNMSAAVRGQNTLEGYVEILNMADIPPDLTNVVVDPTGVTSSVLADPADTANYLFEAILHVAGTPPCKATWPAGTPITAGYDAINGNALNFSKGTLLSFVPGVDGPGLLRSYGLDSPSGGLTGGWVLLNQTTLATFSGNDVALKADGTTNVVFSPQKQADATFSIAGGLASPAGPGSVTADPLLTGGRLGPTWADAPPAAPIQWFDVPDLSTPLGITAFTGPTGSLSATAALTTPTAQADALASLLGKLAINDEYVNDPNGAVAMITDWVISQPTRRYFAVVDYFTGANGTTPQLMYNSDEPVGTSPHGSGIGMVGNSLITPSTSALPYSGSAASAAKGGAGNLALVTTNPWGPVACLINAAPSITDREETTISSGADFSPGFSTSSFCGEVAVLSWGGSPLQAVLTASPAPANFTAGWANFGLPIGTNVDGGAHYGLPGLGFAAASTKGLGISYGTTWPLRWN